MTQEDKQLLLKDLCARLPYGVFCVGTTYELDDDGERYIPVKVKDTLTEIHNYKLETASVRLGLISSCKLETVKPYLRPMSSMTEEEEDEWWEFDNKNTIVETHSYSIDWLNAHHFDYRNLIERGLAIAVTEDNNPYKE
ncbi:MAG: hypothetical protein IIZ94_08315 [Prevotella sp.]|nr:hypothetical protein [Prevotella sp.]